MFRRQKGTHTVSKIGRDRKKKEHVSYEDIEMYTSHLKDLHANMITRFKDLFKLRIPDWIIDPFNAEIDSAISVDIEEELFTLKSDFEVKPLFKKSCQDFWLTTAVQKKHPSLWERIKVLFIAFPTFYLVERSFSAVIRLLTKERRNKLMITDHGDLCLLLTNLKPDIDNQLLSHQAQPSHYCII